MKIKFKAQPYQAQAVDAVVNCFGGQLRRMRCALPSTPVLVLVLVRSGGCRWRPFWIRVPMESSGPKCHQTSTAGRSRKSKEILLHIMLHSLLCAKNFLYLLSMA